MTGKGNKLRGYKKLLYIHVISKENNNKPKWNGFFSQNSKFLYAKDAPYVIDTSEIGSEVFIGIEAKGLSNRWAFVKL